MAQMILPLIPKGATQIKGLINVWCNEDKWTYFHWTCPIFTHRAEDTRMFRMITSQLNESGTCKQVHIIKAFGVSKRSVIRSRN